MKAASALCGVFLLVVVTMTQSSPGKYGINRWRLRFRPPTTTIHIINGLQPGSDILLLHCQSGDTDLGFFVPQVGEEGIWKFKMNIFYTTDYFCGFWWNQRQIHMDVYNKYMVTDGKNLYYTVTEDGVTFGDAYGYVGLVHAWDPAPATGSAAASPSAI